MGPGQTGVDRQDGEAAHKLDCHQLNHHPVRSALSNQVSDYDGEEVKGAHVLKKAFFSAALINIGGQLQLV